MEKTLVSSSLHFQRLLLWLSEYDLNNEYLKGKGNVITDALFRVSDMPVTKQDGHQKDIMPVNMLTTEIPADSTYVAWHRKATAEAHNIKPTNAISHEWLARVKKGFHILDYWTYREEISAENNLLFKGHRLIISEKLQNRNLKTIQEGHFSIEKMQQRAKESVFWQNIRPDILQTAWNFHVFQIFSKSQQQQNMMSHEVPQGPWNKIGGDIFDFEFTNYLLIADY